MSATITRMYPGATEVATPTLVDGYEAARESTNIVIPILGGGIAVAYGTARTRKGTLQLFFATQSAAWACVAMHALLGYFTITSTDATVVGMSYVVAGEIGVELDDETRRYWVVTVEFQEV